jgi:hypothetical protein
MAIRSSLQGQATPSQASQEAALTSLARLERWFVAGAAEPGEVIELPVEIGLIRAALLSHPPKGGDPEPERPGHSCGPESGCDGICSEYAAWENRQKGEGGPVARGGFPDAARLVWAPGIPKVSGWYLCRPTGEKDQDVWRGVHVDVARTGFATYWDEVAEAWLPTPGEHEWAGLIAPETPPAPGEASEPAPLTCPHGVGKTVCCDCNPVLRAAPASPKPSQGREWPRVDAPVEPGHYWYRMNPKNDFMLIEMGDWKRLHPDRQKHYRTFEWRGPIPKPAREVVEPQERGEK